MTSKIIMKKLHDINLMVIKLRKKIYIYDSVSKFPLDKFWYDVKINTDGSLTLGFHAHIINNDADKTYIKCKDDKDLDKVKQMLNKRLDA